MSTPTAAVDQATETIQWAHDSLDFTWEEIADVLGTTTRTLQRWRSGDAGPNKENLERLDEVEELRFWLATVFGKDKGAADEWLRSRLLDLRGRTPLHLIKAGKVRKISDILATFHSGAFI